MRGLGALVLLLILVACRAPAPDPPSAETRGPLSSRAERCASNEPLRQAFFGDVHIHTSWSMDANVFGTTVTPDDAYRFAQGAELTMPGGEIARLDRALDFAMVSEHAENIGEVDLCTDRSSDAHALPRCAHFRGENGGDWTGGGSRMSALNDSGPPFIDSKYFGRIGKKSRAPEICGEDLSGCVEAQAKVWQRLQASANRWNDDSEACRFTTFHGYEWTFGPRLSKIHRNVLFRNDAVPANPLDSMSHPSATDLFEGLTRECLEAGTGCDVLTIPHNPNFSDGHLLDFPTEGLLPSRARELAALRAALEPLVEIMQVKGDSECRNGFANVLGGPDELCDFEKTRSDALPLCDDENAWGSLAGVGCTAPRNFVRYALVDGLRHQEALGVNPFKWGITASTDVHNGNPGDTEESSNQGWRGAYTDSPAKRLSTRGGLQSPLRSNPGGLMGVWAKENSRDSLFEAMQRRETFGTSGTRIRPRLFAAWELDDALCGWPDHVQRADAIAVPMGSDLPTRPSEARAPVLIASALQDPGTALQPGNALERIQIVKGWAGPDGAYQESVHDVAVTRTPANVDTTTCEVSTGGEHGLCAVWQDPDFDPAQGAFYYARVVEVPSCRWNAWECLRIPEEERPASCSDPTVPRAIRERAWTSPIWYTPS